MTQKKARASDAAVIDRAIDAYSRASAAVEPFRAMLFESYGLTIGQLQLMRLVEQIGAPSIGELANCLGFRPPTVSALVERLRKNGMVERYHDDQDRRVVRVRLTEMGDKLTSDLHQNGRSFLRTVFERIGIEATERISNDMAEFATAIQELIEEGYSPPIGLVPSMFIGRVHPYTPP
jgi:DNA-binding MarR family transcriptional regulator